jgi:hypothetical protein
MSVIGSNILAGASGAQGYQISRSVRLRASASAYFSRTFGTPTNNKIFTWSGWVKRGKFGIYNTLFACSKSSGATDYSELYFDSVTDQLIWQDAISTTVVAIVTCAPNYRDPSAWYHVVLAVDTTQATAANRIKIYVNGAQVTSFNGTPTYYALNNATSGNVSGYFGGIGSIFYGGAWINFADNYVTEANFIDGQALTPSSFGQTNPVTGVWQPIKYTGTYGTNGFYLNFSDNSAATAAAIGKDYSGNGNNWTPNNISVTAGVTYDSMLDVPTLFADGGNGRGNYATLNAVDTATTSTLSNGNLTDTLSGATGASQASTISVTSGKWYWEVTESATTNQACGIGIMRANLSAGSVTLGTSPGGVYYYSSGNKYIDGTGTAYGTAWGSTGTTYVIGIALDADAGTVTFYLNNTSQGAITLPSNTDGWRAQGVWASASGTGTLNYNFGQRPFSYTPPTGFVALNTQNLPTPTISNGANYMAATLYNGNSGTQTVTNTTNGISFQPDLVWVKNRNSTGNNVLYNPVTSGFLYSNLTNAEDAAGSSFGVASNGFALNTSSGALNFLTFTYVAWQWQAGKGSTSSNTSGSITSTVSVNTTAGFSVVTYSGNSATSTIGHGLGVAPAMFIVKRRNSTGDWYVYHQSLGATKTINLDLTSAAYATANAWNNTAPTSSVFTVSGASADINNTGGTYVAYCFSEVAGYSKFGSYTGNGSTDGTFVYTNFQPRWIMVKRTDSTSDWLMYDTSRNTYNEANLYLGANVSTSESTGAPFDILSNGFKCRNTIFNVSSGTYIFAAFASSPFKLSLAR